MGLPEALRLWPWSAHHGNRPAARRGRARLLTTRRVERDFALWEDELGAAALPTALRTVIGDQVVEVTVGERPIQEIAGHLRRLRFALDTLPAGVSFARWEGVTRAYDDYLFAACHTLGVPTDLVTIPLGLQRDDERRRLERLLTEAGLPVRAASS